MNSEKNNTVKEVFLVVKEMGSSHFVHAILIAERLCQNQARTSTSKQ